MVIVFPGALGDLLLAVPALRALRAHHAGARLTLVVAGPLRALASMTAVADAIQDVDGAETARLFVDGEPPAWLRGRPVLYAWIGADDPSLRARVGRWTAEASFHRVERGDGADHATSAYAHAIGLRATGATLAGAARIEVAPSAQAADVLARVRRPVLAMHRGAGAVAKRWDADGFAAVAAWWRAQGGSVIDVVGPAESDLPWLAEATRIDTWSLPDLAALLAGVDAYAGSDSGVSHLAGAAGAAGVVIFTATASRRWRPASARLQVVTAGDDDASGMVVDRVIRALCGPESS